MKIYSEIELRNFDGWSGGADTIATLTDLEDYIEDVWERLEEYLDEIFYDGIEETELNDYLWFENDEIAQFFDFENWEELCKYIENGGSLEEDDEDFEPQFEQFEDVFIINEKVKGNIVEVDTTDREFPYMVRYTNADGIVTVKWFAEDELTLYEEE